MAKNSLLYLKNKIKTSLMYYPPAPESPRQKALNVIAMLFLTFMVGTITLGSGRTNVMQGAIHLVLFAAFLFLTIIP